jgi:hypothetical protein
MHFGGQYTGKGQYVGTYLAWGVHNNGWWGEGEIKFYMDGDTQFPRLMAPVQKIIFAALMILIQERKMTAGGETTDYTEFSTAYTGLPQVIRGDGTL